MLALVRTFVSGTMSRYLIFALPRQLTWKCLSCLACPLYTDKFQSVQEGCEHDGAIDFQLAEREDDAPRGFCTTGVVFFLPFSLTASELTLGSSKPEFCIIPNLGSALRE